MVKFSVHWSAGVVCYALRLFQTIFKNLPQGWSPVGRLSNFF